MMKKEGSLGRVKNIFEKKKTGLYRVLLGHPRLGLTCQVGSGLISMLKQQKVSLRVLIITYSLLLLFNKTS
jgi:hypothetical protein